tara:strand:+ start:1332 stop:3050 length:1719 start_codon:yes stop_codon:yes gene_type:complete
MAERKLERKIKKVENSSPMGGGSFLLRELSIVSPSNPNAIQLNGPGVFEELNIYEDLFSNVLRGTFTFVDNQGIAETIPIIGDETLILSFSTPGAGATQETVPEILESGSVAEEAFVQRFRVYDCEETTTGEKTKIYKLFFVSKEYIVSTKTKVSKGYKGKHYGEPVGGTSIVEDMMKKINKEIPVSQQKKLYIEKTATPQNVIIPNWTPFQAINFCASRSLSTGLEDSEIENPEEMQNAFAPGSLFVFYEKLGTGFFYESIESMIVKQSSAGNIPLYQYTPKLGGERSRSIGLDFYGVEEFDIAGSFKTLENLGYGMYGSKLIAYDPIRMRYDEVKFDYYEKEENPIKETLDEPTGATIVETDPTQAKDDSQRVFADFIGTDVHPTDRTQNKLISENSDFLGSNDAVIKLATTTKSHDAMFVAPPKPDGANTSAPVVSSTNIGVSSTTFKDSEAKPNQIENWLLQREMQVQEYKNIIINFNVAGNSARHVGDLVRFELPTSIPPDDVGSVSVGHQLYSGYYIVSKIRHIITQNEYKTDMELIKNSFAKRIPGQLTKKEKAADDVLMSGEIT